MNRAERRRLVKEGNRSKVKTYSLTQDQLESAVREGVEKELARVRQRATDEAIGKALLLLLTLPLEVLKDHYWKKSYRKRLPKFTEQVLEYYDLWQAGEIDIDKLKADLLDLGGITLEEV